MLHIILFGPPGCGKGTQAKIIENKFGFVHLSTGIIFRNHIKKNTKLGKIVSYYINKGKLVPDFITTKIINKEIKKNLFARGIIYDGYPRTKKQVVCLKNTLNKLKFGNINAIFHFLINSKIIINRLIKRGQTSKRNDDLNYIIVKNRIDEYYKETYSIWNNEKFPIFNIEASYSIEKISNFIIEKIKILK